MKTAPGSRPRKARCWRPVPAALWLLLAATTGLAQVVVFSDDMEGFPTGWTLGRLNTGCDFWARVNTRRVSGSYSAKCTNRSNYLASQNTWFQRPVDLSGYSAASLSFWDWCDVEPTYDYVRLELHSPSGWAEAWRRTGHQRVWRSNEVTVPPTTDSIRFRFVCDNQQQYEGFYIDDVRLLGYVPDVGVTAILAPPAFVDSGSLVMPACSVYNYSLATASYRVRCRIGTGYSSEAMVSNHVGLTGRLVLFQPWYGAARGPQAVRCSTILTSDTARDNDWRDTTTFVRVHDVGAEFIVEPRGAIDSGFTVTPQATIRNFGTEQETVVATMRIGDFYQDSRYVYGLAAGDTTLVTFTSRIVTGRRGNWTARCTTYLNTDRNPVNDTADAPVQVQVHDVGAIVIIAPGPLLDSGQGVAPYARVWNFGSVTESFDCVFNIGDVYSDTQPVSDLPPQNQAYVLFTPWIARPGSYVRSCSTVLGTDRRRDNDRVEGNVFVRFLDAAVSRILAPHSIVVPGTITPRVEVANNGNQTVSNVPLQLRIDPGGYSSSRSFSLDPGRLDTVDFDTWNA
ncbi:hypothetical protein FJY71_06285, partial [candidate division WOR-3 bacterium]|nr:hypothetical protein [candidate division WOR-3 bacterium]